LTDDRSTDGDAIHLGFTDDEDEDDERKSIGKLLIQK